MGYSPPKCSCNGKYTHSSEFMIPTRMSTCPIPCLESSPTPSHMLMPCMKTVSKPKYLFYLWVTLRYKYVGQSSEVNLLGNSPKQFMGLSDVNCWMISQHNSSDYFPIKLLDNPPKYFTSCTHAYYCRVSQYIRNAICQFTTIYVNISNMHILTKINTQQHVIHRKQ